MRILAFTPSEMGSSEQGVMRSDLLLQEQGLLSGEQSVVRSGAGEGVDGICPCGCMIQAKDAGDLY